MQWNFFVAVVWNSFFDYYDYYDCYGEYYNYYLNHPILRRRRRRRRRKTKKKKRIRDFFFFDDYYHYYYYFEKKELVGAVTTGFLVTPLKWSMEIRTLAVDAPRDEWLPLFEQLETYAAIHGCETIEMTGRKGWQKVL